MKHLIILGDGMADLPLESLEYKTPLEVANTFYFDLLASLGTIGLVQTIDPAIEAGSGPANMSVMGYDPLIYYTGRSPLEALSLGINLKENQYALRCNFVTLASPPPLANPTHALGWKDFTSTTMLDYSAGEISTEESFLLIESLKQELPNCMEKLFLGKSYRHCLLLDLDLRHIQLHAPHDFTNQSILSHLPTGLHHQDLKEIMLASYSILYNHPVNQQRREKKLPTADMMWLWGEGTKPTLPDFFSLYGKKGGVISAVDLLFGLAKGSGLEAIEVEGATGNLHTNYAAKADSAIKAFKNGLSYIYLHVEAPDECGHQKDVKGKIKSIEQISNLILKPVWQFLASQKRQTGEDYKILLLPDHPTPISTGTHSRDPVPFALYQSQKDKILHLEHTYSEKSASQTTIFYESGPALFAEFIQD